MKNITIASVCVLLSLGACSHYNEDLSAMGKKMEGQQYAGAFAPQDIAPAAGAASGQTLNATLAGEYYTMARYENDKAYDYKAAKIFTQKAKMASNGKLVVPGKVSSFDIPEKWQPELNRARGELISALKTQNTPENASALGTAQARYECWLERAEEAADEAHYQSCKSEFEAAMAQLVMPAAGAPEATTAYDINFAGQSAVLDRHSKSIVQYLANYLNSGSNSTYNVNLTGFMTGAEGSSEQSIINARVIAVRDELIRGGVAAARVNPLISAGAPTEMAGKVQALLVPTQPSPNVQTKTEYVPLAQPVPVPATTGQ
jgi:OOP family OmpA-OmpF porin